MTETLSYSQKNRYIAGKCFLKMNKEEKEELENEIRKRYPGVTQDEITLMLSIFNTIQAHKKGYQMGSAAEASGRKKAGSGKKKKADRLVDSKQTGKTYIIYISIEECPVKVFRRIMVPSNLWLGNLARIIIEAVGWDGYHLWQFTKNGVNYTSKNNIEESERCGFGFPCRQVDDMTVTVADVLPKKGSTITFEYDFGDSWTHNVRVSSISDATCPPEAIQVTSGKGACPPEDVGGVWGYAQMLDILSGKIDDPEEKASYEEWLGLEKGETFDAEDFDIDYANDDVGIVIGAILDGEPYL